MQFFPTWTPSSRVQYSTTEPGPTEILEGQREEKRGEEREGKVGEGKGRREEEEEGKLRHVNV